MVRTTYDKSFLVPLYTDNLEKGNRIFSNSGEIAGDIPNLCCAYVVLYQILKGQTSPFWSIFAKNKSLIRPQVMVRTLAQLTKGKITWGGYQYPKFIY